MNTPFWDATHLLRSLNAALPSGWEVYQITLTKDSPSGYASATGACFRPYKCGGRAGSLSTNVIPKTRMTFTVPWPLPPATLDQIPQTTSIEETTPGNDSTTVVEDNITKEAQDG